MGIKLEFTFLKDYWTRNSVYRPSDIKDRIWHTLDLYLNNDFNDGFYTEGEITLDFTI